MKTRASLKYFVSYCSLTLHLERWSSYFRHRHSVKFSKIKLDSTFIKSHQCSLGRSHAVLIELNSEF